MKNHKRRNKSVEAAALAAVFLLTGCGKPQMPQPEAVTLEVEASVPTRGSVKAYSEYMGEIEAGNETIVMPFTSGQVTATYFEEGGYGYCRGSDV